MTRATYPGAQVNVVDHWKHRVQAREHRLAPLQIRLLLLLVLRTFGRVAAVSGDRGQGGGAGGGRGASSTGAYAREAGGQPASRLRSQRQLSAGCGGAGVGGVG